MPEKKPFHVIGFAGKLESGKSTASLDAAMFIENHYLLGGSTRILSFAYPFKKMMMDHFGFTKDQLYTTTGKTQVHPFWNMTVREFMQRFGDGMRKEISYDVWVKVAELKVKEYEERSQVDRYVRAVIFDDVRMPNEAEMIRRHGGKIIKIIRPDHEAKTVGIQNHVSEKGIPDELVDFLVINDGNMEKFKTDVCRTVGTFLPPASSTFL